MATTFRAGAPSELGSLDPGQFLAWVIEYAGRAVGYLVLTYPESPARARHAYVSGLYVCLPWGTPVSSLGISRVGTTANDGTCRATGSAIPRRPLVGAAASAKWRHPDW